MSDGKTKSTSVAGTFDVRGTVLAEILITVQWTGRRIQKNAFIDLHITLVSPFE